MQHYLRRLALGAALGGGATAPRPAIASAASTCSFDPASQQVTIMDGSGSGPLILSRSGRNITYSDDWGEPQLCVKGVNVAGVTNTAGIYIQGPVSGSNDGYLVDESNGPFIHATTGNPEIKIDALTTGNVLPVLTVRGTNA